MVRPQGVGRQPVRQNEAQSNHSEMNALEDSQRHTVRGIVCILSREKGWKDSVYS